MDHKMDQDDIMLSSAEDLNNEMDFGMESSDETALDEELADLEQTSEPEPEEPMPEEDYHEEQSEEPVEEETEPETEPEAEAPAPVPVPAHHRPSPVVSCELPRRREREDADILSVEPAKINKLALAWMIILTIILAGVIGIMVYAFIVYQGGSSAGADDGQATSSVQGSASPIAIAGALEVYLDDIDLNRYDSDLVLVSSGGTIKVTGTLKHTLYINATDSVQLVLDDATVAASGAAIVNVGESGLTIEVSAASSLSAGANKFGAVIYSAGLLEFTGEGGLSISALAEGVKPIVTTDGFNLNGTTLIALSRTENEVPLDSSEQGYIAKGLKDVHQKGSSIAAVENESGTVVAEFTADCDFSYIMLSNQDIKNDTLYRIEFGGGEKVEE